MTNFKTISNTIKSIADKSPRIAALSWAILDANADTITVTDLDIFGTIHNCGINGAGKMAVDAHALQKIAASTKKNLTLTMNEKDITALSDGNKYTLESCGDVGDFPELMDEGEEVATAANVPLVLFNTVVCASTEETRYYLKGICLESDNGLLKAIAIDGHRMAYRDTRCVITGKFNKIIMPKKAVEAIQTIYALPVKLTASGTKCRIEAGDVTIVTKLVDGNFPDYQRVIPPIENAVITAPLDVKTLLAFTAKKTVIDAKCMVFNFGAEGINATLTGTKCRLEKPLSDVSYPDMVVGANIGYIESLGKDMAGGSFTMHIIDASAPIRLQCADSSAFYILMPMRA